MNDHLTRFAFANFPVRGAAVRLTEAWQAVLARQGDESWAVTELLGEALAASSLMFSNIKFNGRITLQLQGGGPLNLLMAQCDVGGAVRGIVRGSEQVESDMGFEQLTDQGTLVITLESRREQQRYQGIVGLDAVGLAKSLEGYFQQSEQIATRIWLAADADHASGLILQQMPEQPAADDDGWNRVVTLAETITPEELLGLDSQSLLHRLYHDESLALGDALSLRFDCPCSRDRVADVLRSLGADEIDAAMAEQTELTVDCEFCNQRYSFDVVDLAQLFSGKPVEPAPDSTQ